MSEQRPDKVDLNEAVNAARAERARPLRLEQYRKELMRLIEVSRLLTVLLYVQEPNIEVRRQLEKLESTVFVKRKSIDVEMSRERVQEHLRQIKEEIEALIDIISRGSQ